MSVLRQQSFLPKLFFMSIFDYISGVYRKYNFAISTVKSFSSAILVLLAIMHSECSDPEG